MADVKALAETVRRAIRTNISRDESREVRAALDALAEVDRRGEDAESWKATANMRWGMVLSARGRAEAAEAEVVRLRATLKTLGAGVAPPSDATSLPEKLASGRPEVAAAGSPTDEETP